MDASTPPRAGTAFGPLLRDWRRIRRMSQLDLALAADVSSRHVSFLESGRAGPSRAMVLRLAEALNMPRETANEALGAAGFAAAFPALPPDADALAPVREAVRLTLANHAPYPAVVIDAHWDLVDANPPAMAFFTLAGVAGAGNLVDAFLAAAASDVIENWEEIALVMRTRIRAEIAAAGGDRTLERFADAIDKHPRLADFDASRVDYSRAVAPTVFRADGVRLSLFSVFAHFGGVQDVRAADLRIELMFPADEPTRDWFRRAAD